MQRFLLLSMVLLLAISCATVQHVAQEEVSYMDIDGRITDSVDPIEALVEPYRSQLSVVMDEVLAITPKPLVKARPSSTLGQWFAEVLLDATAPLYDGVIDVAIQNYGGLRIPEIPAGPITVGSIFELMPFDNTVVFMTMTGTQLQELLDHTARDGGWPLAGASFEIDGEKAVHVEIGGRALEAHAHYTVMLPDYVANGGNDCDFLQTWPREDTGVFIRDAVIPYLRAQYSSGNREIHYPDQPNITDHDK